MSDFAIGDRVEATYDYMGKRIAGKRGTVREIGVELGVEFDEDVGGHDLSGGLNVPKGRGWYVPTKYLKKVDMDKPKRTFKLLKDTPGVKKGALFQEQCTDGTQPYELITPEYSKSTTDGRKRTYPDRSLVENQPSWFIEVFQVNPQYMTQAELDQFEEFKSKLKVKKAPKSAVRKK